MSTGTSNVAKVGPVCDLESNTHATQVEELAQFVCRSRWGQISEPAREQLKLRVLDSLGVALGALDGADAGVALGNRRFRSACPRPMRGDNCSNGISARPSAAHTDVPRVM